MKRIKTITTLSTIMISLFTQIGVYNNTFADDGSYGLTVTPLSTNIVLTPGEEYTGSFNVFNPSGSTLPLSYVVEVRPYYVDEEYRLTFDGAEGMNQIVNWITVNPSKGEISPNQGDEIFFTIKVPETTPAGGQYAAIYTRSNNIEDNNNSETTDMGANFSQTFGIPHIIYAEIAGTTKKNGDIADTKVSSFLLDGNISGSSAIKNTGNVHGTATYKMQVFPLFSGEEIFTNEENPETHIILPDRTYYNTTTWDKTPFAGIFNVVYTVEFEGVTAQVSKIVIKCPIWLLFIIIFIIAAIIIYIIAKARKRNIKRETA